jgi:hypothetical protein
VWDATRNKNVLLVLTIFIFAFVFRAAVLFHNAYPPSSDIGLHGSIINIILDEGELPLWNPYHMGGEPLATPPGFHFFVSIMIMFTGMSVVVAELVTAALFSAFIVFPAYLVAKKMWKNDYAGLLAAFFAAISALSLEMISWGGYTNVVSIALMILFFYLFIKDLEQPRISHLLLGTLLVAGLTLTHTFTLSVFLPILALFFVLLIIGKIRKLENIKMLRSLRFLGVCGVLGALVVMPWILRVLSFYVDATAGLLLGGVASNKNLILDNRTLSPVILGLLVALIPAFFIFKSSRKRFFDTETFLLIAWFIVPVVMTQAYIVGIYVDYSRFMYFIDFPGIVIISAALCYLFHFTTNAEDKHPKIRWLKHRKWAMPTVFTVYMFIFIILSPWSIIPNDAMDRANYYTTIQQPEATGIDWIQTNTAQNSVLIADHLYGWWLSGLAKRPTLSAASLEFLLYENEIEVAQNAQFMLDTDYFIDNGLIQVRENGPNLWRHNPGLSIQTWSGKSYSMMYFQDNQTTLSSYYLDGYGNRVYQNITLADLKQTQFWMNTTKDEATVTVIREDDSIRVTRTLTAYQGVRFVELSFKVETKNDVVNVEQTEVRFNTTNGYMTSKDTFAAVYDQKQKVCGEVIFQGTKPTAVSTLEDINQIRLLYSHTGNQTMNIDLLFGVFDAANLSYPEEVTQTYYAYAESPKEVVTDTPLFTWNYVDALEKFDVSYVVCRYQIGNSKFSCDPRFRLVFNAGDVSVFQVVK